MSLSDEEKKDLDIDVKSVAKSISQEEAEIRAKFDYQTSKKLLRKVDLRLFPMLLLAYLLKNMDASLISYVKTINVGESTNILTQLHISGNDYSWTATAFTIAFVLAEIPSTMLLKWQTPRLHFVRIITGWSIACCCQAAAKNLTGLLVARTFLGFFEGGLYPAIVCQVTYYYRPDEMGVRLAVLTVLSNFANIFDALITYGLGLVSGRGGLSAWQMAFIIEGAVGFLLAFCFWMWHIDFPDTAKFLTEDEKKFIIARLPPGSSRSSDDTINWTEVKQAVCDPLTWSFSSLFFVFNIAMTGYTFWLPTVISQLGFKSGPKVQLLNIPPAALYVIFGILAAWIADEWTRIPRALWCLMANLILLGMFCGLAYSESPGVLYFCICMTGLFSAWYGTLVYPWRTQTLKGATYTAVAFGIQNTIAQTVNAFSPQIFRTQYAPRYRVPYLICIGFFGISCVAISICWWLTWDTEIEVRRIARERKKLGKETGEIMKEDITLTGRGAGTHNTIL